MRHDSAWPSCKLGRTERSGLPPFLLLSLRRGMMRHEGAWPSCKLGRTEGLGDLKLSRLPTAILAGICKAEVDDIYLYFTLFAAIIRI